MVGANEDKKRAMWFLNSASNMHVACDRLVFCNYEEFDCAKRRSINGFAYGFSTKPKARGK